MRRGKLYVIEGSDGSGKATQSKLLYERLLKEGKDVKLISFPDYNSDSSALVKMYLAGEFGKDVKDVNVYAASSFYAVDRFASFKKDWEDFYNNGGIIIADRYTTSNMVHQAAKITNKKEKDKFLNWLWELEFELFELPIPDLVLFLDVKPEISQKLMNNRLNKITKEKEKDIHEKNSEFLLESYNNALYVAKKYSWKIINCSKDDKILSKEAIHQKIYQEIKGTFL